MPIDGDNYSILISFGSGPWEHGHTVRVCFFHDDACKSAGGGIQTMTGEEPQCVVTKSAVKNFGWEDGSYKSARFDPTGLLCKKEMTVID
jgi:hypothetical protein